MITKQIQSDLDRPNRSVPSAEAFREGESLVSDRDSKTIKVYSGAAERQGFKDAASCEGAQFIGSFTLLQYYRMFHTAHLRSFDLRAGYRAKHTAVSSVKHERDTNHILQYNHLDC